MMLQSGLALLLCVAAVTAELSTALGMAVVYMADSSSVPHALMANEQADTSRDISTD
jgi:hypothetical protein